MDPMGLQNVLWDLMPSGASLDELVGDWDSHLSETIDEVVP